MCIVLFVRRSLIAKSFLVTSSGRFLKLPVKDNPKDLGTLLMRSKEHYSKNKVMGLIIFTSYKGLKTVKIISQLNTISKLAIPKSIKGCKAVF